jgi:hypothetical protein
MSDNRVSGRMARDLYAIYSIWLREMLRFFRLKSRLVAHPSSSWHFLGLALGLVHPCRESRRAWVM